MNETVLRQLCAAMAKITDAEFNGLVWAEIEETSFSHLIKDQLTGATVLNVEALEDFGRTSGMMLYVATPEKTCKIYEISYTEDEDTELPVLAVRVAAIDNDIMKKHVLEG